ncbi:MAG: NFACT family protein [Lachnospiraceae bacterium]|jgi:predicted ribosome quality control (RQC) complex YloA/Tae2 family protein|nr:NFACT family protein [Lachnospiraceae bacterium]
MAFDGITIACIVKELRENLIGGRIAKIAQPERDELILTIKTNPAANRVMSHDSDGKKQKLQSQRRLFISADASLPLIYLTDKNKPGPMTAPGFCMLLRKHLNSGRIMDISQPGLERIVHIHISHSNEMGDREDKVLIIEIMGKHSNIIFTDGQGTIIDSIKHVAQNKSSLREVLPGRPYFVPESIAKVSPLTTIFAEFQALITAKAIPVFQAIYTNYSGISPIVAQEICFVAGIDGEREVLLKNEDDSEAILASPLTELYDAFSTIIGIVKGGDFHPTIYFIDNQARGFAVFPMTIYADMAAVSYDSASEMLEKYYQSRNAIARMKQKSADLRKTIQTLLKRERSKYDLQAKQVEDSEERDRFRIYGELLNTYGHDTPTGAMSMTAKDHYSGEDITIALDPRLSTGENAKRYFEKYAKMKRTATALAEQMEKVKEQIVHLESIAAAIEIATEEEDLTEIKEEMIACGYLRRKSSSSKDKGKSKSRPLHFMSSDGFHIHVGKNNYQNEEITFKLANGGDWWFHAKAAAGSHVIVSSGGRELSDRTFEEAAALAAYYSNNRPQEKVEVDYTERKNLKKPNGAMPGYVIYHTYYSMVVAPNLNGLTQID